MAINCDYRLGFHQCGLASTVHASDAEIQVIAALLGGRARGFARPVAAKLLTKLSGRCTIRTDTEKPGAKTNAQAKPNGEKSRNEGI
jgi:hypothetical protein|tara:strand:- start:1798 stop:2058 length:261 start_codon:yes stop_codon:yes gene_type:complete